MTEPAFGGRTLGAGFEPAACRLGGGCPIQSRPPERGDEALTDH